MKRSTIAATLALLGLALVPTHAAFAGGAKAPAAPARHVVAFPADTAMHPSAGTEWWYFVGHLGDASGHVYGFETTFFKFSGLRRYFSGSPVDTAFRTDVAVTDEAANKFYNGVTYAPQSPLTRSSTTAVDLSAGTMRVRTVGTLAYHVQGAAPGANIDLTVRSTRPPMLVNHGYLGWGSGYTYYYSLTHMQAQGTITIGKRTVAVHGVVWNDHQWGNMSQSNVQGWQWMALQFADGTDTSLVQERPTTAAYARWSQTLTAAGTQLYDPKTSVTVLSYWRSPSTHIRYPSRWRVQIPAQRVDVTVSPTIEGQEVVDHFPVDKWLFSYWEGSATFTGTREGKPASGKAYVELTGYNTPPTTLSL